MIDYDDLDEDPNKGAIELELELACAFGREVLGLVKFRVERSGPDFIIESLCEKLSLLVTTGYVKESLEMLRRFLDVEPYYKIDIKTFGIVDEVPLIMTQKNHHRKSVLVESQIFFTDHDGIGVLGLEDLRDVFDNLKR